MPFLPTAQEWLTQSTLLLQARPSTTRITTKYTLLPLTPLNPHKKPRKTRTSKPSSSSTTAPQTPQDPPRATLTLKTFDPQSGVTLKYSTTKQAEVSRLIQILGRLARPMAGLAESKEEDAKVEDEVKSEEVVVKTEQKVAQAGAAGGGGGKGKKKKGKK